jgi:hypothetical protein
MAQPVMIINSGQAWTAPRALPRRRPIAARHFAMERILTLGLLVANTATWIFAISPANLGL